MADNAKAITLNCTGTVGNPQWIVEGTDREAGTLVSQLNTAFDPNATTLNPMGHHIKVVLVIPQD